MHQDEVKVFRGNVETHVLRLQRITGQDSTVVPGVLQPAGEEYEEPPRPIRPPELAPLRRELPLPARVLSILLSAAVKTIWVAVPVALLIVWKAPLRRLLQVEPYLPALAAAIGLTAAVLALRKALRERGGRWWP
jgi:hypothetical protein